VVEVTSELFDQDLRIDSVLKPYMDAPLCQAFRCVGMGQDEIAAIHPASLAASALRALMEYADRRLITAPDS
jgi:hypothetical protein